MGPLHFCSHHAHLDILSVRGMLMFPFSRALFIMFLTVPMPEMHLATHTGMFMAKESRILMVGLDAAGKVSY